MTGKEEAFKLFKDSGGKITSEEIAEKLDISELRKSGEIR